jgi:hypothetical protein
LSDRIGIEIRSAFPDLRPSATPPTLWEDVLHVAKKVGIGIGAWIALTIVSVVIGFALIATLEGLSHVPVVGSLLVGSGCPAGTHQELAGLRPAPGGSIEQYQCVP